ncbi:MAG: HEAT repeat domain-containing protein [Coprobacter sp.]|nr:HEAT repeat domain-containing protein [Coprobacter sp.]
MDTINVVAYYFDLIFAWIGFYLTFIYDHFRDFAVIIQIASVSMTVSILVIIGCLLRVLHRFRLKRRWIRTDRKLQKRYGDAILYVMGPDTNPNLSRSDVLEALRLTPTETSNSRNMLKNFREQITFCRIVYRVRISEEAALGRSKNLHILLSIFGVQNFLEDVINKGKLRYKVEAMHMLRAFKMPINPWIANQLMSSNRPRVRRLSMYASIMSNSNSDLDYFESEFFDNNCCIYDEIQLGYVLSRRRFRKRKIPNLAHWAHLQKNPDTQCVFIRLMRQFNQHEYCDELEDFFQHNSDKQLINEISRTWGYLRYDEGEEQLSDTLLTQSDEIKVTIMHALTRINSGKSLDALVEGYKNNGDPYVRFEALRCLYNYGDTGRLKFAEFEQAAQGAEKQLFEFFYNPLTRAKIPLSENDTYRPLFGENIFSVG